MSLSDLDSRLAKCFSAVFPALDPGEIREASHETVPGWDSLAALRLVAVVEEEFGAQIDLAELTDMVSFASIRDYLQRKVEAR